MQWKWGTVLALIFAVAQIGACSCEDETGDDVVASNGTTDSGIPTPTVKNLSSGEVFKTNQAMLTVEGNKDGTWAAPGLGISATVNDATGIVVSGPTLSADWSGPISLKDGLNTLTFVAVDVITTGESPATETFMVELDSTAPGTAVLNPDSGGSPPACIGAEEYTIAGMVEAGGKVFVNGTEVETGTDGSFSTTVPLQEGSNTVVVVAEDAAGNRSEDLTVELVKGVTTPTLNPVTSPADGESQEISGTKGANTGIELKVGDGSWMQIVPPSPETTWTYTLALEDGENVFTIQGVNSNGDASCDEVGPSTILLSDVCVPFVDVQQFQSPTTEAQQPVTGTKCAQTGVWLRFEDQALEEADEVVALNGAESFDFTFTLEEGDNTFYIHNKDSDGVFSAAAGPFTITLDTMKPAAPIFDPEPPAQSGNADLTLTGTKEEFTNLCLRRDQEAQCIEIIGLNAGTNFEFDLFLHEGDNFFCISSFDAAGNQSDETCRTVTLVEEASVAWLFPLNGTIITQNDFTARVRATDDNGIESVEICFNSDCAAASENGTDTYSRTVSPGDQVNGSVHTLVATATNTSGIQGRAEIRVVYITGGLVLSESTPASSERAKIAVDGKGNIHAVWADQCSQFAECDVPLDNNFPFDIFHRMFDGETWSDITNLSLNMGDADSRNPVIEANELGIVHIAWQDTGDILGSGGDTDIYHTSYDPEAEAWTSPLLVTTASDNDDRNPSLGTGPDGAIVAAWERVNGNESDIFISRFANQVWGAEILVSNDPNDGDSRSPEIGIDNLGVVYVVWQDRGDIEDTGTDWDIYLKSIGTNGAVSETIVITDNALDDVSVQPDISVDQDGFVHVIWLDTSNLQASGDDFDIFYRRYSEDGGLEPYRLVTNHPMDGSSDEPSITSNPLTGELYIAWLETGNILNSGADADIYFTSFQGAPGPITLVSSGSVFNDTGEWPSMAFDPRTQNLHIVWEDDSILGDAGDDRDVFYLGINLTP